MPLFKCDKCHCVENTACGYYWMAKAQDELAVCSECNGEGWHNLFPKMHAAGYLVVSDGFLWTKSQVAADLLPKHLKIVGVVNEYGRVIARATGEAA